MSYEVYVKFSRRDCEPETGLVAKLNKIAKKYTEDSGKSILRGEFNFIPYYFETKKILTSSDFRGAQKPMVFDSAEVASKFMEEVLNLDGVFASISKT